MYGNQGTVVLNGTLLITFYPQNMKYRCYQCLKSLSEHFLFLFFFRENEIGDVIQYLLKFDVFVGLTKLFKFKSNQPMHKNY
jgi:hypothetical protein